MELTFTTYRIKLNHTFGISRSAYDWYDIVYIFIKDVKLLEEEKLLHLYDITNQQSEFYLF